VARAICGAMFLPRLFFFVVGLRDWEGSETAERCRDHGAGLLACAGNVWRGMRFGVSIRVSAVV
jgi:hypothetical protein